MSSFKIGDSFIVSGGTAIHFIQKNGYNTVLSACGRTFAQFDLRRPIGEVKICRTCGPWAKMYHQRWESMSKEPVLHFVLEVCLDTSKTGTMVYRCREYDRLWMTRETPRSYSITNQNSSCRTYFQIDNKGEEFKSPGLALASIGVRP